MGRGMYASGLSWSMRMVHADRSSLAFAAHDVDGKIDIGRKGDKTAKAKLKHRPMAERSPPQLEDLPFLTFPFIYRDATINM